MGLFDHPIEIGRDEAGPFRTVSALVDTGAIYTWIPQSTLRELGVQPAFRREFELADGTPIERDMATIHVRIDGREHPTPCIFGDEGTDSLLGVVTLEELGFGVDPVNRQLIPVRGKLAELRVVRASELSSQTAQTGGMLRKTAIDAQMVGARNLWVGYVTMEPGARSGAHHHGECESAIYVISGRARFRFGERLEESVDAGPGDFIYVPPDAVHEETNASDTESIHMIVTRDSQANTVVNVDLPS